MGMIICGVRPWLSVSFLHVMSSFSKCCPFQQHSVGRGSPPRTLSVPLWFCWVCQEFKALTTLNQGDFSGFYLYWAILRDKVTPPPKSRIASAHYKSSKSPKLRAPSCITAFCMCRHPGKSTFIAPRGLWAHVALVQTCCSGYCFCCECKVLCLSLRSLLSSARICQPVAN